MMRLCGFCLDEPGPCAHPECPFGATEVLGSDGIHPSMDSDIYAKAVRQTIEQWIASGR